MALQTSTAFHAANGGTKPYPEKRIGFEVLHVESVATAALETKFVACRRMLETGRGRIGVKIDAATGANERFADQPPRSGAELAEAWAFVGCGDAVVQPMCDNGRIPPGHPLNPTPPTDAGWFGDCRRGVYVGTCSDYVLKYSNSMVPLSVGDEVRVLVFKVLPGKVYKCAGTETGCAPKEGFDSHMSPHDLEWYLPLEGQSCPAFVLTIKAIKLVGNGTADDS